MKYKIGDKVVHPFHGAGIIAGSGENRNAKEKQVLP